MPYPKLFGRICLSDLKRKRKTKGLLQMLSAEANPSKFQEKLYIWALSKTLENNV